ncbi:MAG: HAD family hydrolase [Alphaproteobacteria bacterium]|nr:HAD family hydrolase [Alphaproteobacteria bacterium]
MRARAWIFDLDGTLTVASHDFAAMKRSLGLPVDQPILEGLAPWSPADRAEAFARIEAWEWDHAATARPAPGAHALLDALRDDGAVLGIVTRNLAPIAWHTLEVIGLQRWFDRTHVLGRTCAAPKPAGDGLRRLLDRWGHAPADAVMVGDGLHDVGAGRAAGVTTVLVRDAVPPTWHGAEVGWDHHHRDLHGVLDAWVAAGRPA